MPSIVRGFVNRRLKKPTPQPPPYTPKDPKFVIVKPRGEIPHRHPFDGWQVIMDLADEGWVPQRYKDELWLYGPMTVQEVFDAAAQ